MKKLLFTIFILSLCAIVPYEKTEAATPASQQKLIVNTTTNKMDFYQNGTFIRSFSVATGKAATPTPIGSFIIVNKIKNRPYYTRHIKGGDPRNPLGDRWMGLNMVGTWGTTYAVHGTNNNQAIGKNTTLGCIRMFNEDIHWLFDRVEKQATVIVTK
ncbi:L,D-transpeptidase [Bacillus sp. XF8]|uniref:L,D-transpeptidase n=1 Tax=Bacillus sp. XF8 TaxID=2819289 RepID=UPI001AA086E2|nr:L,D-transpeptidase [Bacillus sp. XF8]MBO1580338.1 L,D-transpeptidase [Bacillus sp. XF8]